MKRAMPIVLGVKERTEIAQAIDAARRAPTPVDLVNRTGVRVKQSQSGELLTHDMRDEHFIPAASELTIPFGYRCCFSFEEQSSFGLCRHLSVSQEEFDAPPIDKLRFDMLVEAFGMSGRVIAIWPEEYEPGRYALNILSQEAAS